MNAATIRFAQLANQKSQNPELKRFAQTIEQDHKKAQVELESLAKKYNVTLPTSLDAKCEEEITRLQALSGSEFDREFAKGAVEGHAMAAAHMEQGLKQVKDADVKQYTQNMLTHVRNHQRQGREIAKAVGIDQATITSLENKALDAVGTPGARTESGASSIKDKDQPK